MDRSYWNILSHFSISDVRAVMRIFHSNDPTSTCCIHPHDWGTTSPRFPSILPCQTSKHIRQISSNKVVSGDSKDRIIYIFGHFGILCEGFLAFALMTLRCHSIVCQTEASFLNLFILHAKSQCSTPALCKQCPIIPRNIKMNVAASLKAHCAVCVCACVEQLKLNIFNVVLHAPWEDRNRLGDRKYKKKHACKINRFYKLSFGLLRCFQKVTDSNDTPESFCNGLGDAWQPLHTTWQKHGDAQGEMRLPLTDGGPPSKPSMLHVHICALTCSHSAFVLNLQMSEKKHGSLAAQVRPSYFFRFMSFHCY